MKAKKITKAMRSYAGRIKAPDGWTREVLEDRWTDGLPYTGSCASPGTLCVKLLGPDAGLVFAVSMGEDWSKLPKDRPHKRGKPVVTFSGTTLFKTERGWRSFNRTGVGDSFYSPYGKPLPDPKDVIAGELKRIEDWREADVERVDVPTMGYRIAPATRDEYARKLKAGGCVTFTPAGFGTGHRLSVRRPRHPYANRCKAELAAFFGVPELWDETFDHD